MGPAWSHPFILGAVPGVVRGPRRVGTTPGPSPPTRRPRAQRRGTGYGLGERLDDPLTPPLELPAPAPVESQAAQPEHDHAAGGTGDIADAAETPTDGATRGVTLVAAGVPTSLEDEADPFGPDVEH